MLFRSLDELVDYCVRTSFQEDLKTEQSPAIDCPEEKSIGDLREWARTAKPGALNCFYEVIWIAAIDPKLDDDNLICEVQDHEKWEELTQRRPDSLLG